MEAIVAFPPAKTIFVSALLELMKPAFGLVNSTKAFNRAAEIAITRATLALVSLTGVVELFVPSELQGWLNQK